jgi:hypothetical protein
MYHKKDRAFSFPCLKVLLGHINHDVQYVHSVTLTNKRVYSTLQLGGIGRASQSPLYPSVSLVTPDFDFRHIAESMVSKIVGLMHDKYYPLYD